jgi:hypothetical protein
MWGGEGDRQTEGEGDNCAPALLQLQPGGMAEGGTRGKGGRRGR